ncbi:NADH-quinone oxidoreductase subunit A [Methanosarcinales archaeon]|uniref:NADH dehydrogenase subunit A n=1 Tax=Candidatus Syntropharchaeum caldarium TaxID=1838285 RepID=A0A1F2P860_9EURY|nr:hypothetical protein [Candidatus Syntrophoarchaeum sp.]OFV67192.1 MAG: NADH dehydrogenase subunit A [Candidatus Syntrophoarchaeum caldarius]RLG34623.1 MAG: NADH-quinone oxidoreductase subunit A [Methanosarcinales archaeon]
MIENAIVIGVILAVCVLTDVMILALSKILPTYHLSDLKVSRWEAGNLPVPAPKSLLPMEYLGYMFIFMAVEPVVVAILVLSAVPALNFIILLALSFVLIVPAIYVGIKSTTEAI